MSIYKLPKSLKKTGDSWVMFVRSRAPLILWEGIFGVIIFLDCTGGKALLSVAGARYFFTGLDCPHKTE